MKKLTKQSAQHRIGQGPWTLQNKSSSKSAPGEQLFEGQS